VQLQDPSLTVDELVAQMCDAVPGLEQLLERKYSLVVSSQVRSRPHAALGAMACFKLMHPIVYHCTCLVHDISTHTQGFHPDNCPSMGDHHVVVRPSLRSIPRWPPPSP
jgi:hypothetical protein